MNKEKLLEKLKEREYRDAYVSDHIDMGISLQMRALREQKGYNQKKLGELAGMKQEAISRLENPDYEKLNTLKRLAAAFDVGLLVRFVPFGELVKWEFSPDTFKVPSFDDDPYCKGLEEKAKDKSAMPASNPMPSVEAPSKDNYSLIWEGHKYFFSESGVNKTLPASDIGQEGAKISQYKNILAQPSRGNIAA